MGMFDDIKEIVSLSKDSGMNLSEVIQLMKMASSEDKPTEKKEKAPEKTEEPQAGKQEPEKEPQKEEVKPSQDDDIDYKKKYEELEKRLSDLQKENVSKDLSNNNQKSDDEIINEITKSFM